MQKRLFYVILETIRTTDTELGDVEFPVPLLRSLLSGTYGSFQNDLFNAAQGLVGTSFSILKPSGSWAITPIFDRIEYLKAGETNNRGYCNDTGEDVVRAKLHRDLEGYLLKLERNYNTQDLIYVLTIPRVRSHRLYEILLHESWRGERPEFEMSIEDLQSFLGIEESYKRWQDFKRTLSRQQTIIHKFTDMRFEYEGRRTGRTITRVQFHVYFVKQGVQGTLEVNEPHRTIEEIQIANELKDAGYAQDAYAAIATHGLKRVRRILKQAKAAQKASVGTKSEIRNLGGFIHYRLQQQDTPETELPSTLPDGRQPHVVVDAFIVAFEQARDDLITKQLEVMTQAERQNLREQAVKLMNAFERDIAQKGDDGTFKPIFYRYLLKNDLIYLMPHFKNMRAYYASKDFGFDALTNENIFNALPE